MGVARIHAHVLRLLAISSWSATAQRLLSLPALGGSFLSGIRCLSTALEVLLRPDEIV
jgi:hypothetical protein